MINKKVPISLEQLSRYNFWAEFQLIGGKLPNILFCTVSGIVQ